MIHVIKLATRPDEPNVNGISYSKESLMAATSKENFLERLKAGNLPITIYPNAPIDLSTIIGNLRSIDFEANEAEINIDEDKFKKIYPDDRIDAFILGMQYIAHLKDKQADIDSITCYNLIKKEEIENVRN